jgi:hypothetical protein
VPARSPQAPTSLDSPCDVGGWTKDGQHRATHVFEAAAWFRAIKPVCRCGHSATFNPYGIWWRFECRMWDGNLVKACQKFWCVRCGARTGKRVRPVRIELVDPSPDDIALPMPEEREWKRALSRFRA